MRVNLFPKSPSHERRSDAAARTPLPLRPALGAHAFHCWRRIGVLLTCMVFFSGLAHAKGNGQTSSSDASSRRAFDSSQSRIVVDHFSGSAGNAAANTLRDGVTAALEAEDTVDLISVRLLDGQRASLDGSPAGYAGVARRLDLAAILRGKVKSDAEGAHVTLTLINGRDGKAMDKMRFEAPSLNELRAKLRRELWGELKPLLDVATGHDPSPTPTNATVNDDDDDDEPAAKPEPAPEPTPERPKARPKKQEAPSTEPEPAHETEAAAPSAGEGASEGASEGEGASERAALPCKRFEVELGGGSQGHYFNYVHEQRGALRGYRSNATAMGAGRLSAYPFANASCSVRAGIALGYDGVFKIKSHLAGRTLGGNRFGDNAELVLRLGFGPVSLEPGLGYSDRHSAINGGLIPDANYHALRARLRTDLELNWFLFELVTGARYLLSTGRLGNPDWFPSSSGLGYDVEARVGVRLEPHFDLLLGGRIEFYAFKLHATGDGAFPHGVADGAYDRYFDGSLALRLRL